MLSDSDYEQMQENLPGYCSEASGRLVAELNAAREQNRAIDTLNKLLGCKWLGKSPVAILQKPLALVFGNDSATAILDATLKQQDVNSIDEAIKKVESAIKDAESKQEKIMEAGNDYGVYHARLSETLSCKELRPLDNIVGQTKQLANEYKRYVSLSQQLKSVQQNCK